MPRRRQTQRIDVLYIPGVMDIVGDPERGDAIPPHDIAAVRRLMQWGECCRAYPYNNSGTPTRIVRGPLQGLYGNVVRESTTCLFVLAVPLIQQAKAVNIALTDITEEENTPSQ